MAPAVAQSSLAKVSSDARPRPANLRQHSKKTQPFDHSAFHATTTHEQEPTTFSLQLNIPNGNEQWLMNMELLSGMALGLLFLLNLTLTLLIVSGSTKINGIRLVQFHATKLVLLLKVSINNPRLTIMKPLVRLLNLPWSELFSLLRYPTNGPSDSSMLKKSFLHRDLHKTVYLLQPPWFVDSHRPNHVYLIHKSLYGLKQAPCAWFHRLSHALHTLGFIGSHTDPSFFHPLH